MAFSSSEGPPGPESQERDRSRRQRSFLSRRTEGYRPVVAAPNRILIVEPAFWTVFTKCFALVADRKVAVGPNTQGPNWLVETLHMPCSSHVYHFASSESHLALQVIQFHLQGPWRGEAPKAKSLSTSIDPKYPRVSLV